MKVLLTNDDGLHAPGIEAFRAAVADLCDLWMVAPHEERSGASHGLTMNGPLRIDPLGERRFATSGTPVDCVYLAIHSLLGGMPQVVLSGINKGANLGDDVIYSGTVAAAREAALNGIQALAVSLATEGQSGEELHFDTAARVAVLVLQRIMNDPLPPGVFLNLNVPNVPLKELRGVHVCPLGRRHYDPWVEARTDPRGKTYYWVGGAPLGTGMGEGTDGWWVSRGFASLTPLGLDTTREDQLEKLKSWSISLGETQ